MKKVIVQKEISVKKCNRCDKYGRIVTLNVPDKPEAGCYYPFCDCEYGKYKQRQETHGDMFYKARHGI